MTARAVWLLLALLAPGAAFAACSPVASRAPKVWSAAAGDPPRDHQVAITFVGHATFLIESPQGARAATDYSGQFGPAEPPDIATMNRAHSMHHTAHPDPRIRHVLKGWQDGPAAPRHDLRFMDMRVTNLPTNIRDWGGGTIVNGNSVFMYETAGLCIAHLGHLHHLLEPSDLDALGRIDILMLMVDGGYSLGHEDARALVEQIQPRVVLPMHWFARETLHRFLAMMRGKFDVELRDGPTAAFSRADLPARPTVVALPGPH